MTTPYTSEASAANDDAANRIVWADDEAKALAQQAEQAKANERMTGSFIRAVNWLYKTGPGRAVTGITAGAALATGLVIGSQNETGPERPPISHGQTNSSGDETIKEPPVISPEANTSNEAEIAQHRIELGQTPEALAQNIAQELSDWNMAGAAEFNRAWLDQVAETANGSDAAFDAFLDGFVAEKIAIGAEALFGPDYKSNPEVQVYLNGQVKILKRNLSLYSATATEGTPYLEGMNLDTFRTISANEQELDMIVFDNATENKAATFYANSGFVSPNGERMTISITTQDTDSGVIIIKIRVA